MVTPLRTKGQVNKERTEKKVRQGWVSDLWRKGVVAPGLRYSPLWRWRSLMRTACPGNLRATALVVILANRHPLLNCQECHWLLWPLQVLSCSSSLAVSSRTLEWLCLTVSQVAKWKCSLCRENKVGLELGGNLLIPENVVSAFFKPTKNNFDILENKGKKMDSFAFLYTKWGIWVQSYLIWSYFEHEKKSLIF